MSESGAFDESCKKMPFACSGSYINIGLFDLYENKYYGNKVTCEFCKSSFWVSKENIRCPSCGGFLL